MDEPQNAQRCLAQGALMHIQCILSRMGQYTSPLAPKFQRVAATWVTAAAGVLRGTSHRRNLLLISLITS